MLRPHQAGGSGDARVGGRCPQLRLSAGILAVEDGHHGRSAAGLPALRGRPLARRGEDSRRPAGDLRLPRDAGDGPGAAARTAAGGRADERRGAERLAGAAGRRLLRVRHGCRAPEVPRRAAAGARVRAHREGAGPDRAGRGTRPAAVDHGRFGDPGRLGLAASAGPHADDDLRRRRQPRARCRQLSQSRRPAHPRRLRRDDCGLPRDRGLEARGGARDRADGARGRDAGGEEEAHAAREARPGQALRAHALRRREAAAVQRRPGRVLPVAGAADRRRDRGRGGRGAARAQRDPCGVFAGADRARTCSTSCCGGWRPT